MNKTKLDKSAIPKKLRKRKQWVCWKRGQPDQNGRTPKIPIDPKTGKPAKINDFATWATFKKAHQYFKQEGLDGVGFVFTENDPYCGIDLDNCRSQKTGELEDWAKEIIKAVNSYTEISPSSTGVKIIVEGKLPGPGRRIGKIEMYDHGRYFTITGQCLDDFPKELKKKPKTIKIIYDKSFKEKATDAVTDNHSLSKVTTTGNCEIFNRLCEGNWTDYESQSEADLAFISRLLRKTGGDAVQADTLFRKSKLYRSKWDEKHSAEGI